MARRARPHPTTLPTQVRHRLPRPPRATLETEQRSGGLCVAVEGQRFGVRTARVATQWLPDTPSHRHLTVVWLRLLVDAHDKPLFTLQA